MKKQLSTHATESLSGRAANAIPMALLLLCLLTILPASTQAQIPPYAPGIADPFGLVTPVIPPRLPIPDPFILDIDHDDTLEAVVFWVADNAPFFYPQGFDFYENTGSNAMPVFQLKENNAFGIEDSILDWPRQFVDLDGDGVEELIFAGWNVDNPIKLKKNRGTPQAPDFSGPFMNNPYGISLPTSPIDGGTLDSSFPYFVDIDNDNDLDLFFMGGYYNNAGPKVFYFSENIDPSGNGTSPQFAFSVQDPFGLTFPQNVFLFQTQFTDIDCDDDQDLFLIGPGYNYFFPNTGTPNNPDFSTGPDTIANPLSFHAGTFVDIHEDGDPDLITAFQNTLFYYENISPAPVPSFAVAKTGLTAMFSDLSTTPVGQITRWLWDFGDDSTSTDQNPMHLYPSNGRYEVCLTVWQNCRKEQFCDSVFFNVGIEDELSLERMAIYPSPADEYLMLEIEAKKPLVEGKITFFDMKGQLLLTLPRKIPGNTFQERIPTEKLPAGTYLLRFESGGKFKAKKFTVIH